ncbi:Sucrase/ferredoxin-like-domain-containing protein [Xylariaceae sp. FL0016]|nr:Sucrase/ferredoxin-like-domain-containing protein [Xylariaceae sp. FL0016]
MSLRPIFQSQRSAVRVMRSSSSPVTRRFLNTVPRCPSPTCDCAATPELPENLPIDHEGKLNGLISSYAEQVLVCTGKDDWASRIEEDNSGDNLAADLKELIGRGGVYSDPFHNVSVLNSSFPPSISRRPDVQSTSAYLLPSFKYIPFLPRVSFESVNALVRGYLQPSKLHSMHDGLSPIHKDRLRRKEAYQHLLPDVRDVDEVLVLICGHGGRDMRCGIMGPVLQSEFERQLPKAGVEVLQGPVVNHSISTPPLSGTGAEESSTARVGLISHIGGHKFAGNVIVYLPPTFKNDAGNPHPLAGHGVWYGRIEPKHVEGVVQETIIKGNIITDHFRGAIKRGGEIIRLLAIVVLLFGGVAYAAFTLSGANNEKAGLNKLTFAAFTITSREQVSPTAFILNIRPSSSQSDGRDETAARIAEAWRHGLWSVEIKQPQLQIARHYTPLPPVTAVLSSKDSDRNSHSAMQSTSVGRDEPGELSFLIRKMDGGEMSNYLSKLLVGETIWLRGPHLGFDVPRRLGGARDVVFLAGGTGVAPALQLAWKLLDEGREADGEKPYVSILWANRKGADALGRKKICTKRGWFGLGGSTETEDSDEAGSQTSLAREISELKKRHGEHFRMSYFVDDEKSSIGAKDLAASMSRSGPPSPDIPPANPSCRWHSANTIRKLSGDSDSEGGTMSPCSCAQSAPVRRPGARLLLVSGPDGFIEAYTGPKMWHEGNELQGDLRGLIGQMQAHQGKLDDWLVLKL